MRGGHWLPLFVVGRLVINPASIYVGLIAVQGCTAAGRKTGARQRSTSRFTHLRQCCAGDNQKGQDDLFDCRINSDGLVVGLVDGEQG
jgi:hypothetical protein